MGDRPPESQGNGILKKINFGLKRIYRETIKKIPEMKNIKPYANYLEESFSDPFNDYPNEDPTGGRKIHHAGPIPKEIERLEDKFLEMLEEAKKPSPEDLLKILKEFDKMNLNLETLAYFYKLLKEENPEFDYTKILAGGGTPSAAATEAAKIVADRAGIKLKGL